MFDVVTVVVIFCHMNRFVRFASDMTHIADCQYEETLHGKCEIACELMSCMTMRRTSKFKCTKKNNMLSFIFKTGLMSFAECLRINVVG